mgnify:CR=1 FL=1
MFNIIKSEDENAPLLTVYSIFTTAVYGLVVLSETLNNLSSSSCAILLCRFGSSSADVIDIFVISKFGMNFLTPSLISSSIKLYVIASF